MFCVWLTGRIQQISELLKTSVAFPGTKDAFGRRSRSHFPLDGWHSIHAFRTTSPFNKEQPSIKLHKPSSSSWIGLAFTQTQTAFVQVWLDAFEKQWIPDAGSPFVKAFPLSGRAVCSRKTCTALLLLDSNRAFHGSSRCFLTQCFSRHGPPNGAGIPRRC